VARPRRAAKHDNGNRGYFLHEAKPVKKIETAMPSHLVVEEHHCRARVAVGLVKLKIWQGSIIAVGLMILERGLGKSDCLPDESAVVSTIVNVQQRQLTITRFRPHSKSLPARRTPG